MDTLFAIILLGLFVFYLGVDYAENGDEAIVVHIIALLQRQSEENVLARRKE